MAKQPRLNLKKSKLKFSVTVTLKKDVPVKNKIEEFILKNVDKDKLYSFLREMEFNRLLSSAISKYGSASDHATKDIEKNVEKLSEIKKSNYQLIKNQNEIKDLMRQTEEIG